MSRRVDPPYTLFRGEDFRFNRIHPRAKRKKQKQSTKHNTEIEVKSFDFLPTTLSSRGPASAIVCCLITFAAVFFSILKKGDT